jgi:hypothetical protein
MFPKDFIKPPTAWQKPTLANREAINYQICEQMLIDNKHSLKRSEEDQKRLSELKAEWGLQDNEQIETVLLQEELDTLEDLDRDSEFYGMDHQDDSEDCSEEQKLPPEEQKLPPEEQKLPPEIDMKVYDKMVERLKLLLQKRQEERMEQLVQQKLDAFLLQEELDTLEDLDRDSEFYGMDHQDDSEDCSEEQELPPEEQKLPPEEQKLPPKE